MSEGNAFLEFMNTYQVVIYPTIIGVTAVVYKTYSMIKKKVNALKHADSEKVRIANQQKFSAWEHEESMKVLTDIYKKCNLYKDKSKADRVAYLQLENGTVASSRLCNMFMSYACEDSRYSDLPKEMLRLRRIPYGQLAAWIEALYEVAKNPVNKVLVVQPETEVYNTINNLYTVSIGTQLASPVFDHNHVFVGAVIMDYIGVLTSEQIELQLAHLLDFRAAVYSCLISYHEARTELMKELNIREI